MSLDLQHDEQPLGSVADLYEYFRSAEKRDGTRLLGLEHEKLLYPLHDPTPVPYEGEAGIGAVLTAFERYGWAPFRETPEAPVIAMTRGKAQLSIEPGGQFELSGSPMKTAREAHAENLQHWAELSTIAAEKGLQVVTLGYRPFERLADMKWMPKRRYVAMRQSLGARGKLAHAMMLMTATGQVSLDWSDEADCARKVSLAARISPLLVALYANSPLVEGQPSGFMSYRSHVWSDVDPKRCGYLPSMLDGTFSYQAYIEWALDAPLLFLRRGGQYLMPQLTFRQLLAQGFQGKPAMYADWVDHLSTLFPEVRIKKVLEIRSADCGSPAMTGALAALMRGLLYEPNALAEAERLVPHTNFVAHLERHVIAQKEGLRGKDGKHSLAALAKELVKIAAHGLSRLDPADGPLLEPLREVVASGGSPAERVLALPREPHQLYRELAAVTARVD